MIRLAARIVTSENKSLYEIDEYINNLGYFCYFRPAFPDSSKTSLSAISTCTWVALTGSGKDKKRDTRGQTATSFEVNQVK